MDLAQEIAGHLQHRADVAQRQKQGEHDRPTREPDPDGSLGPVERAAIGAGLDRPADGTTALLTGAGHLDRRGG